MKPETPLPWNKRGEYKDFGSIGGPEGEEVADCIKHTDIDYILHACNAYPQLINFLENCLYTEMGGGAGALLKELGEDS